MSICNEETTTLAELKEKVGHFLVERNWEPHHSPKNLAMSIAIEAAELMEIFQWADTETANQLHADSKTFEHIQEEVADVIIYCISLARTLGFDLAAAIDDKISKNARKYPAKVTPRNGAEHNGDV